MALVLACGGGGDGGGGTGPVPVASVVITSPATAPSFATLGRTLQFAAEARGASGAALAGRTITWASLNAAVATVNPATGLVTAVGDGVAQITASSEGVPSAPVGVTVSAVANSVVIAPPSVVFGALNSTRQLTAVVRDSGNTTIPGRTVSWSRTGPGTTATVSAAGLVTAAAVGTGDTAVATTTSGPVVSGKAPITVTQVVNTIAVTGSLLPDTLKTTGSRKQFAASAADSNGNTIPGTTFTWTSTSPGVATVDNTGLVTAVSDGSTAIQAVAGGKTGSRTLVVRRYAETFSLAPTSPPAITTSGGTQVFTGTAQDSVGTNLTTSWVSLTPTVATVSPATGTSTTATAVSNGTTQVVMSGGTRAASASLTVNLPVSFANDVQPIFTTNCALSGCHTGANPTGSLNLSAGSSRAQLVNIAAVGFPGATRVIPGDASNSYLIRKLEGGPNISGSRMPEGAAALPAATIQKIRDWITAGALNN
jgi:hypothetical protein